MRRRGTAASRRARPGCGADRRRSCAPAPGRCGRGSARAGRIRREWSRRPRARTPSARRDAAGGSARLRRARSRGRAPAVASWYRAGSGFRWAFRMGVTRVLQLRSVSAARRPDLIAPSIVAGKPVAVQSPARTRLAERRPRGRALAVLLRGRGERGPLLLYHAPRRHRFGEARAPCALPATLVAPRPPARVSTRGCRPRSSR